MNITSKLTSPIVIGGSLVAICSGAGATHGYCDVTNISLPNIIENHLTFVPAALAATVTALHTEYNYHALTEQEPKK